MAYGPTGRCCGPSLARRRPKRSDWVRKRKIPQVLRKMGHLRPEQAVAFMGWGHYVIVVVVCYTAVLKRSVGFLLFHKSVSRWPPCFTPRLAQGF